MNKEKEEAPLKLRDTFCAKICLTQLHKQEQDC